MTGVTGSSGTSGLSGTSGVTFVGSTTTSTTIAGTTTFQVPKTATATATESDLQTALTGALTYFTIDSQSYTGILDGNGVGGSVSPISALDTGLSFVAGNQPSTGPHSISVAEPNGSEIMLVADDPADSVCFGILDVRTTQSSPYLAGTSEVRSAGAYFVAGSATGSQCSAASPSVQYIGVTTGW